MMTLTENLLDHLIEECAEVIHRCSKSKRFGLTEIQEGQTLTNADRIAYELADLTAVVEELENAGHIPPICTSAVLAKKVKMAKYQELSRKVGTLQ